MPTYPSQTTFKGGFYNNVRTGGVDDRVYTAEDVRKPYDTVFSDGIMPDADGTAGSNLNVTTPGGMKVSVAPGHAKLGGAWFENTAAYVITLDNGSASERYDCVIIRNDDNVAVRAPSIYIKSLSSAPTIGNLTRDDKIYEICVAYVKVPALSSSITASNIVDTRTDGSLCNVMSGVGATVVRTYENTYFSQSANQRTIPIGISQFDRTRDTLTVVVEGRIFTPGTNYSILSNTHIQLTLGLPVVGTRIFFQVVKSVNAAGAESVVQEVAELRTEMNANNNKLEHHYYCNGLNDNVIISQLAQTYTSGGLDYGSMRLVIHGHFGAVAPYAGAGTSSNRYQWFVTGSLSSSPNRKLILDFSDCEQINLPITAGTYNDVFGGNDAHVIGANIVASQSSANTMIRVFSSASGVVYAENCRFWITASLTSYISQTGTFVRCRGSVTVNGYAAYCFYATAGALLRVQGGEYYAYSSTGSVSAVVYQTAAGAVVILYGINCPTVSRSGYVQSYAVNCSGATISITDTITTLSVSVPNGNICGTLAISKAGQM